MPRLTVDQRLQGIQGIEVRPVRNGVRMLLDEHGQLGLLRRYQGEWQFALNYEREYPPMPPAELPPEYAWTEDEEWALRRLMAQVLGEEVR